MQLLHSVYRHSRKHATFTFDLQTLPETCNFYIRFTDTPGNIQLLHSVYRHSRKHAAFTFGLQTLPETLNFYIRLTNTSGNVRTFYIRCTNTPENYKTEILKPHETNPFLPPSLPPSHPPCLLRIFSFKMETFYCVYPTAKVQRNTDICRNLLI
jgi:hypothetical protein